MSTECINVFYLSLNGKQHSFFLVSLWWLQRTWCGKKLHEFAEKFLRWRVDSLAAAYCCCMALFRPFICKWHFSSRVWQLKYYWRRRRIHPPLCWCDFSSLSHGETQLAMAWSWMEGVIRFTSSASSGGGCKTHSKWIVGITLPSWYRYFNQSRHVWLYRVVYKLLPRMIWGES